MNSTTENEMERIQKLDALFDELCKKEFPLRISQKAPETKRNHFLPVTYLEGFLGPQGQLKEINPNGLTRIGYPKSLAYKVDFYTIVQDGHVDRRSLEATFGAFETHWGDLRREWNNGGWALSPENKGLREFRVAWFLAFQFLRTPFVVAASKTVLDEGSEGLQVRRNLGGSRNLARYFFQMRWAIYRCPRSFLTAEVPMTTFLKNGIPEEAGPERIQECIIPLTQDLLLIMNLRKDLCRDVLKPEVARAYNRDFVAAGRNFATKRFYLPDDKLLTDFTAP